jgi:hypothetical protein
VRSPQRPGPMKMVLYLGAATVGVAAIVFLVIHLAKGGSGTSTPGATTTAGGAGAAGQGFVLQQAARVGKFPLNKPAVSQVSTGIKAATSTITSQMVSTKSGKPRKSVVGIYDTGSTSSSASPDYKGLVFIGYDGTFNPTKVMNRRPARRQDGVRLQRLGRRGVERVRVGHHDHLRRCRVHQPREAGQGRRRAQARP